MRVIVVIAALLLSQSGFAQMLKTGDTLVYATSNGEQEFVLDANETRQIYRGARTGGYVIFKSDSQTLSGVMLPGQQFELQVKSFDKDGQSVTPKIQPGEKWQNRYLSTPRQGSSCPDMVSVQNNVELGQKAKRNVVDGTAREVEEIVSDTKGTWTHCGNSGQTTGTASWSSDLGVMTNALFTTYFQGNVLGRLKMELVRIKRAP